MIGDLRPRIANQGADIVDIKSPLEDSTLISFREQEPNVWEEIVEPRRPTPHTPATPYPQLKGDARKALANVDKQVHKIEGYVRRGSSPQEIEEQLQREAKKLRELAGKLADHENAPVDRGQDKDLISGLRAKANALETKATELRKRMTLVRSPDSEGVEFLLRSKVIYARIVGNRIRLKTGRKDFMQEYVLLNGQHQPLWYAHFHYANAADAKANYTEAPLKTTEQRYETYESAMLKAKDPQQKIDIHHGTISDELAISEFLPLEPR
ncbi:hypothetical protein [Pseudomonas fluorescens]|uniref:hypothetical protein n=1 Tax=Pseudomonas fluorescens TaxID=294 RepID=UPI00123FAC23|nr:hypothetical protein [Pseudomonas fluorescens]VVQ07951.1 hypothetical protein PS914_04790 [Pseudomonas fluorescens]